MKIILGLAALLLAIALGLATRTVHADYDSQAGYLGSVSTQTAPCRSAWQHWSGTGQHFSNAELVAGYGSVANASRAGAACLVAVHGMEHVIIGLAVIAVVLGSAGFILFVAGPDRPRDPSQLVP
jgi:hypothetical protein